MENNCQDLNNKKKNTFFVPKLYLKAIIHLPYFPIRSCKRSLTTYFQSLISDLPEHISVNYHWIKMIMSSNSQQILKIKFLNLQNQTFNQLILTKL
ncbi:hypothetical protein C8C88_0385 [Flavobacterium sp. 123]|nr:hypothetical protein C8C88_0385 [Flavobacterium sp. 123]